ncbi:Heat shock protein, Metallo peptidase, MEROPS family M48B [Desulforamulus reducens MI-1]|uniref:Protease HtpX homolog n=1 Tax=Desulforamulus reducens (strain ATCC BAA-1160 / DSM 100696 / MI-1) TaxID=349161 RepID=A4J405_DESRM|nr:zinc metalloprotease HtpX [Desulforamulus reducens]ABO49808.1 Heat shock protein, Metallo peptidase, MEROPS family M48B [Desulforamulus reducens MI-1]
MNNLKVILLMGILSVILITIGQAVGGTEGATLFLLISLGMNLFSYFYSDKMAIRMTRSQPVSEQEAPELYAIIRNLAQRAHLPMPKVYITPSHQPNAFATGRNPQHAAVAVTEGLLHLCNRDELEGVLAHELAHIANRDILVSTIAAAFAGAITWIANIVQWGAIFGGMRGDEEEGGGIGALVLAMIAPLAATIVQLAISRSREYGADELGAEIAGKSDGLANALLKLERAAHQIPMQVSPAASHMFITNPLSAQAFVKMFSTHPPIQDRVERLRQMRF